MASAQIAVLGVGTMGNPIARRLSESGFTVSAYDSAPDRLDALTDGLIERACSADELFRKADILLTVLPGPREVEGALTGAEGALGSLRKGACWIDLSSNDPRVMGDLASLAHRRGVRCVEAPMGGGVAEARTGELSFFVAGDEEDVSVALPVLEALAKPGGIHRLGTRSGSGNTAKLLANLLWFGQSVAVTEALLLGKAVGLDVRTLTTVLAQSAGGSYFVDHQLHALLRGDYLTDFPIDRVVEELTTLGELARETATPFALSDKVAEIHQKALEMFGPIGGELLGAKLLEQQAGAPLAETPPRA